MRSGEVLAIPLSGKALQGVGAMGVLDRRHVLFGSGFDLALDAARMLLKAHAKIPPLEEQLLAGHGPATVAPVGDSFCLATVLYPPCPGRTPAGTSV